ncbi:MAG: magnesium transporter CorA family protein [Eubacteriales bacterium]|nr:magnesium transporter CorA family protein [Eubacteriales bacterium]MDD4422009.1 magnesium transporter CorA family protein [Eubacteriales bacterium]
MVKIYFTEDGVVKKITEPQVGCWVSLINPSEKEVTDIAEQYNIDADSLRAALDEEERSRIEVEDNYTMVLVNMPTYDTNDKEETYYTIPLSVFLAKDAIITVCLEDTPVLDAFANGRIKDFYTHMKTRFILQLLYRNSSLFLYYLRLIDKKSEQVENELQSSTKNHELIELLKLEKSLVYFTTALRSNEVVLEKLLRNENVKKYPEDTDLLEDVIVENKQAIEMASIYSGILSGMMDAFASVISNNLNIVMKFLAVVTIVMSIPTMIFSAYGMNVALEGMPFASSPYGFLIVISLALVLSLIVAFIFARKKRL